MSKCVRRSSPNIPRTASSPSTLPPKEVLERLPQDIQMAAVEAASFTMYRPYDDVLPGPAEWILRMAERSRITAQLGSPKRFAHKPFDFDHVDMSVCERDGIDG